MDIAKNIESIKAEFTSDVTLVAVSKTKPIQDLMEAYEAGQRIFGENKIQEMTNKWEALPKDIEWHMVGHVQTNKVKYMAPYVKMIHAVHKMKLLKEINKQAKKENRVIDCLLQMKIAEEDSKYGMTKEEIIEFLADEQLKNYTNVKLRGLMGMATFTDDKEQIKREFTLLKNLYEQLKSSHNFDVLSMGMTGDYKIAIEQGSSMIRIGSKIFGARD
ncbi:YggS family pyridoxal phosphate-dependent enzyme [Psychroflexus maritimus]|uniref:Pyridoxal phosphate homeostasis protein n=1 Tax=Psychroflexus maritimus TaxID=2714865 RepID=A0A967AB79_9FLAO|nr:YggS family pyridoxal phosphate-dependent enzyme [Psychroflexus maritimus]NGZ89049.1 YggS family pyridoxal phosphate-dependent enzyme [Psychroflexus maritimus]